MTTPDVISAWDSVYLDGDTPWDTGGAEPVVLDWVRSVAALPHHVVDLGAGTCNEAAALARLGCNVVAVDISIVALRRGATRYATESNPVAYVAADACALPITLHFADLVLDRACFHFVALEHRERYLTELMRVLKPRGYFLLFASCVREDLVGPYKFSEQEIRQIFSAHFDVLELRQVSIRHQFGANPLFCVLRRN